MRYSELWSVALALNLASCQTSPGNSYQAEHEHAGEDAGKDAACAGRGAPLSDLVVTPDDSSIRAALTLVSASPARPIVGNNSWLFALTLDDAPASGLAAAISVSPFMPDHGHGTPTIVRVEEVEIGQYVLEPVHTRMAGYWEVTVLVEAPVGDLSFVVKVCVD